MLYHHENMNQHFLKFILQKFTFSQKDCRSNFGNCFAVDVECQINI